MGPQPVYSLRPQPNPSKHTCVLNRDSQEIHPFWVPVYRRNTFVTQVSTARRTDEFDHNGNILISLTDGQTYRQSRLGCPFDITTAQQTCLLKSDTTAVVMSPSYFKTPIRIMCARRFLNTSACQCVL